MLLFAAQVVRGAGSLFADTVLQIPQLSPAGAAQLAADAEYFANVMSALAVPPPAELVTVQLFAAVPSDSFGGLAAGAAAGGSADVKVSLCGLLSGFSCWWGVAGRAESVCCCGVL